MARIQILTVCLVVSGFCAGCGKAKPDHNDPATSYVVDGAKEDLPAIKAALAGPKPGDALIDCGDQAVEDLAKAGTADAASQALVARFAAACPK